MLGSLPVKWDSDMLIKVIIAGLVVIIAVFEIFLLALLLLR